MHFCIRYTARNWCGRSLPPWSEPRLFEMPSEPDGEMYFSQERAFLLETALRKPDGTSIAICQQANMRDS